MSNPSFRHIYVVLLYKNINDAENQPYFEAPKYRAQPNINIRGFINNKYKVS